MALIDKETIRKEIDKRYAEYRAKMKTEDFTYYEGMADALDLFERFLDTLPEQPDSEEKFRNLLDAMGDCGFSQDNILLLKSIWEDAYGADKNGLQEQPVTDCHDFEQGLEEEISRTYHNGSVTDTGDMDHTAYENIARHFAEWGAKHAKE